MLCCRFCREVPRSLAVHGSLLLPNTAFLKAGVRNESESAGIRWLAQAWRQNPTDLGRLFSLVPMAVRGCATHSATQKLADNRGVPYYHMAFREDNRCESW